MTPITMITPTITAATRRRLGTMDRHSSIEAAASRERRLDPDAANATKPAAHAITEAVIQGEDTASNPSEAYSVP